MELGGKNCTKIEIVCRVTCSGKCKLLYRVNTPALIKCELKASTMFWFPVISLSFILRNSGRVGGVTSPAVDLTNFQNFLGSFKF